MSRLQTTLRMFLLLLPVLVSTSLTEAQVVPNGMYFMRAHNNGSPQAFTEWFGATPIPGANRYALRDFFGYGWDATILPNGQITIDGGHPGNFTSADTYITEVGFSPGYTYNCNRTLGTTTNFPVLLPNSPMTGPAERAGSYDCTIERYNPETNALISSTDEVVELTVTNTRLRVRTATNVFYDGVFIAENRVAFRVIQNNVTGWLPQYASYPGTTTNSARDVLGELNFHDENSFTLVLCRQTRQAIGSQSQDLFHFNGSRPGGGPQVPGDFNQDGALDISDISNLLTYLAGVSPATLPCSGTTVQDSGNLELLDSNDDAGVDLADAVYLLTYLFSNGPAHALGAECVPIEDCQPLCP